MTRSVVQRGWLGAVLVIGLIASAAVGGVRREDVDDSIHTDWASDLGSQGNGPTYFPPVYRVDVEKATGQGMGSCVLISSNHLLTAAHVTHDAIEGGIVVTIGDTAYTAQTYQAYPGYDDVQFTTGLDLALIYLSDADTIDPSVATPAVLHEAGGEQGAMGIIAGFGLDGTGLTGQGTNAGTKRAGPNMIDELAVGQGNTAGTNNILMTDFDNPSDPSVSTMGDNTALTYEFDTAQGDSGGGMFINYLEQWQLAGITSFGFDASADGIWSNYGDESGYVRVSQFVDWIAGLMDADPPTWPAPSMPTPDNPYEAPPPVLIPGGTPNLLPPGETWQDLFDTVEGGISVATLAATGFYDRSEPIPLIRVSEDPNPPFLTGDANGDGQVDGNDLVAVEANFGASGWRQVGDANDDGQVDGNDLVAVEEHFGAVRQGTAAVPEPATLLLLASAGIMLIRKRG